MRKALTLAVAVHLLAGGAAVAGLVDTNGEVVTWGLTPFTRPNQANTFDGATWMTIQNDYAPIDYPGGVGYQPSPGGTSREIFDLEEMHVRLDGGAAQVLLVASSYPSTYAVENTWYLGDLMITLDDQRFAIVTSDLYQGLAPGSIYRLDGDADVVGLQEHARSYAGNTSLRANDYGPDATVAEILGPFAVAGTIDPSKLIGMATLEADTFDYGAAEDGTWLLQYTFDPSVFGADEPDFWTTQITWGCGNDVIRVRGDPPYVPEPATVGMLLFGVTLTLLGRRRRRRAC
jgi:hypothetical protein